MSAETNAPRPDPTADLEARLRAAEARERAALEALARERVKRRQVALRLGSAVLAAVLTGGALSAWQAARATRAQEAAEREAERAMIAAEAEARAAELARKREAEARDAEAKALERERQERKAREEARAAREAAEELANFLRTVFAGEVAPMPREGKR